MREPIVTTTPVLTEAFHMLGPASIGQAVCGNSSKLADYRSGSSTGLP
jgi:hypothetical protein